MKILVLYNPVAGTGRSAATAQTIAEAVDRAGLQTVLVQTRVDAATDWLDEPLTEAGALVVVGGDGAVHQGFCDISLLRVFPKAVLTAAMDEPSLRAALEFMRTYDDGLSAVRYPRDNVSDLVASSGAECPAFVLGKARPLIEADQPDLAILAYGVMAINAIEALALLDGEYKISVYDARFAKPLDIELITALIERGIPLITVEDHGIEGGFGSCVIDAAQSSGLDTRLITPLAIPCRWIYHGARTDQLKEARLDPAAIARRVREVLDPARCRAVPIVTVPKTTLQPARR